MFWMTGLAITLASTPAAGADKCHGVTLEEGGLKMNVSASQQDGEPAFVSYMLILSYNADHSFALGARYAPKGDALGAPTGLSITSQVVMPDAIAGPTEQLQWFPQSAQPGTGGTGWVVHRRDSSANIGRASVTIAKAGAGDAAQTIDRARLGGAYRIERRDQNGKLLASGTVRLPAEPVVTALFRKARAAAIAGLEPCVTTMTIAPAPAMAPPAPPSPPR
ncbi:hypothetical protein HZY97_00115 [Sphingomonas sp. R-74633]|uniref:hypothetical protein n=1 Tax=Sphingomonas sp. R-74633 TaxID=2751188 RepID=UPI0015D0D906|nr:hypothetical protein [Sphingomonas sp. R-74633]NYT39146.1 hypothetical protein [Sphingomonas sp. R-74633]